MQDNYDYEAATQLADQIRGARKSIDTALEQVAAMTQSVIHICCNADAPPHSNQDAIEEAVAGLGKMIDARKGFVATQRKIAHAQRNSNLQAVDFGCLGKDPMGSADLRVVGS